jgi:hypothetical protein
MRTDGFRLFLPSVLIVGAVGCGVTTHEFADIGSPVPENMDYNSSEIRIGVVGALRAGDDGTLAGDAGWIEYVLAIENRAERPITVHNIKLATMSGRYLDSAASFDQLSAPPDVGSEIAGDVVRRTVGIAAGQVVPYGGTIVGIIVRAVSASTAGSNVGRKREFDLRKIKSVELAPAGKVTGSAFLPHVTDAKALVVDYSLGDANKRIEIGFPRTQGPGRGEPTVAGPARPEHSHQPTH